MSNHPFVHIEFPAKDLGEAAKFYSEIFGWKTQHMPEMNYASFETGSPPGGGFNPLSEQTKAGDVRVYIGTDDIEATLAKIESLGGKIAMPKTEIPMVGWFALFFDPTGNVVGLFTGLPMQS